MSFARKIFLPMVTVQSCLSLSILLLNGYETSGLARVVLRNCQKMKIEYFLREWSCLGYD